MIPRKGSWPILYDAVTGERLRTPEESLVAWRKAETRAHHETTARRAAEEELQRLKAEIARLRRYRSTSTHRFRGDPMSETQESSKQRYAVTVNKNVIIPMRDGTKLAADIYLPNADGPFPVLLERTPYNKEVAGEVQVGAPEFFASRGYAVVIQDTRGRFASEGEFLPFEDDGWGVNRDGYDTVEWLAVQPWSSGKIGTIGGSYSGATQYRLLPTRPSHLAASFIRESSSDYHEEWVYRGGAFELAFSLGWALRVTRMNLQHLVSGDEYHRLEATLTKAEEELDSWCRHLPLNPLPPLGHLSSWYNEWLAHPDDNPYWWRWNIAAHHHEIDTPVYHLGGWYDIFLRGTLENFQGIRSKGRSERTRRSQKLIVGPWEHGPKNMTVSTVAGVDFGPDAALDINVFRLRWFDHWLKGIENGIRDEPPVRIFVMGKNVWRDEDDWPPRGVTYTPFYFHTGPTGSVASLNDGRLTDRHPSDAESPESFIDDPSRPLPTRGGGTLYIPAGPFDQQDVDRLSLTYTSNSLSSDLCIIGPVRCILYGLSSARDTDWVVKLCDVYPDGRSILLCDGILRARYRDSRTHPSLLDPGRLYRFEIDLWATANTFLAGHRIRVAISSSNFPRWDRNLNTGGEFGREVSGKTALNTVFHDAERPSHIVLPVIG
ncbi:MAG: CocE/NonD family hydrolase [Candidatus Latescibacteria bacterium]|nr:CocE/NonD family hydrolase [Candidatus Latescibacterota bacterium]